MRKALPVPPPKPLTKPQTHKFLQNSSLSSELHTQEGQLCFELPSKHGWDEFFQDFWTWITFQISPQGFRADIADVHSPKFATLVSLPVICLPKELWILPRGSLIKIIWEAAGAWKWLKKSRWKRSCLRWLFP